MPGIMPEGKVYNILNDAKVKHIPNCLASGDILPSEYHTTKTQNYARSSWACHSDTQFISHQHYRLALDVVGVILVNYNSSYEMVAAMRNSLIGMILKLQLNRANMQCVLALKEAYKAGILHRDLSPGNIIIDKDHAGWLIDWDLSRPLSSELESPRRAMRTVRALHRYVVTNPNLQFSGYLAIHVGRTNQQD